MTVPFRGSRRAWYIRQGWRFLSAYLINDICETWIGLNRHVYPPSLVSPPTHVVPQDVKIWWRALGGFALTGRIYATLTMDNIALSVITVALGMYSPEDWPDLFGSISQAYTVRRVWGYVYSHNPTSHTLKDLRNRYTWHHALQRVSYNFLSAAIRCASSYSIGSTCAPGAYSSYAPSEFHAGLVCPHWCSSTSPSSSQGSSTPSVT